MKRKKRAFSLVEILIALLILGLGIIAVFNLFPLGLQSLTFSRRLNEVSLLAQKKIEELKALEDIPIGENSGEQGNLKWRLATSPIELAGPVQVVLVELDTEFNFLGKTQRQKFITYIAAKQ